MRSSRVPIVTLCLILLVRGIWTPFSEPIVLHSIDLMFLSMGVLHVTSIVGGWLRVEKQPWIVWQGEYKYGEFTRLMVPSLIQFVLLVLVLATGVVLLSHDISELVKKGW